MITTMITAIIIESETEVPAMMIATTAMVRRHEGEPNIQPKP